ncbi:MAG: c-type cytochrome [Acidobacteria bacterium]|nr:c-type cytochrome [Acidobacteriota bacterium]
MPSNEGSPYTAGPSLGGSRRSFVTAPGLRASGCRLRAWTAGLCVLWIGSFVVAARAPDNFRLKPEATKKQPEATKKDQPEAAKKKHPPLYGLGRAPTAEELQKLDIIIGSDGNGLPPGSGTAGEGRIVYQTRCVECHGATGKEGPFDLLVGGRGSLTSRRPLKTIGSYWPYATTLFDYINRAMPFDTPGSLSHDQVYATVAYLLYLNGIIGEHDRLDAATLRKVQMPNRNGFIPDDRPDVGKKKK